MAEVEGMVPMKDVAILHLEDSALDAELVAEHLRADGIDAAIERVWSRGAYVGALAARPFALILADHQLPEFDGDSALAIARETVPATPFIFVSGTLGEDVAVEALKHGATDYVVKRRLERLPRVVRRALAEAAQRVENARVERDLREGEARLRALTDQLPGGMVYQLATSRDGGTRRFLHLSNSYERMTGVPVADVLADPAIAYSRILPEDRPVFAAAEDEALATLSPFDVQARFVRTDGAVCWYRTISTPRVQPDGSLVWDGIQIDISDHKRIEAALAAREARLRFALKAGRLAEASFQIGSEDFSHSEAFPNLFGYPAGTRLTLEQVRAGYHPDDVERIMAERAAILAGGQRFFELEHRVVWPDGSVHWLYGRGEVERDEAGRPIALAAVYLDNSEKKAVEQALRTVNERLEQLVADRTAALAASEARLRSILATSYQYQGLLALDGTVLFCNDTALSAIGLPADAVVDLPFWETPWFIGTEGMPAIIRAMVREAALGTAGRRELRLNLAAGWRWLDFSMRPIRGADGTVTGIVPEAVDITERRQAEEALRQSQKLEAIGQLTGGVAHDFNNLLTPIIGSLDLMHRQKLGGERHRRLIEGALQSAERARTLVQRLLAFARRQPLQPVPVDLDMLIRDMAGLIQSTTGPRIAVTVAVAPGLPPALADANQVEMAILNLSVNARDAMPDGGRLTISADAVAVDGEAPAGLTPGRYVRVSVADTGHGMDAETLARAIEPFFSTKGVGKGTGLGLSMVHGLASQLGGALQIASKPGLGTDATLWLPVSAKPVDRPGEQEPAVAIAAAGRALVVDDEALVRATTSDMLADLGYQVTEAESAEAALVLLDGDGADFDLLVTDHLMSGMSGAELARIAGERWPKMRVLLVSGYADAGDLDTALPTLSKPFRHAQLAASLDDLRGA
ncbi:PAS domain-containing protein [Sphingomonas sanxanigenens]|nr:PAS domain-containing protein [Sphingomonas sanxanigenens]